MNPGVIKSDLEERLLTLPDLVAKALEAWRRATLEKQKKESLLYLEFKGQETKRTADELKAMVRSNDEWYKFSLWELKKEADYTRLYERLLSAKKLCDHRTAF